MNSDRQIQQLREDRRELKAYLERMIALHHEKAAEYSDQRTKLLLGERR